MNEKDTETYEDLWLDCDLIEELRKAAQQILMERAKKRRQPPLKYGDVVGKTGWPPNPKGFCGLESVSFGGEAEE